MLLLLLFLNNVAFSPTYIINKCNYKKSEKQYRELSVVLLVSAYSLSIARYVPTAKRERECISFHIRCNVCLKTLRSSLGLKEHMSGVRG